MSEQEFKVTINVLPLLEETIVDCLLAIEGINGFSSFEVNAHTTEHQAMSLADQVAGRQKKIRFQVYVPEQQMHLLINHLKQNFTGSGIQFWVENVLEMGTI